MKNVVCISLLFLIFFDGSSQDINQLIFDSKSESEILCGYCDREGLTSGQFSSWFDPEYQSYVVDDTIISVIDMNFLFTCSITVVFGTWCSDSQREVPRLCKILDYLHFPENNLTMICVDRLKEAEGTEVPDLNIELVPTIIFSDEGEEMGRIIESPEESLEADMVRIVGQ
jgi:hypothetical protein